MKIKRFNQLNENIDASFLTDEWSLEKIKELDDFLVELDDLQSKVILHKIKLFKPLDEYLRLKNPDYSIKSISNFHCNRNGGSGGGGANKSTFLVIEYYENRVNKDYFYFTREETEDFLLYLHDPELYKSTKKYNL